MSESESVHAADDIPAPEGPSTPDEDETFGAEPDDPRAAGLFDEPYDVPDFDSEHEQRDMCGEEML